MAENIKTTGGIYHNQKAAGVFAVQYIKEHKAVSQDVLEAAYDEWLREMHRNYDGVFEADQELVCAGTKERRYKLMENLSNHGVFEIDHDIVTINTREANRLGYRTPAGRKFTCKWYMTRLRAQQGGYPVHDTVSWDNNANRK